MVDRFGAELNAEQRANFNASLNRSPALIEQLNDAALFGDLRGFARQPAGANAGGGFNTENRLIELPVSMLNTPRNGRYDPDELVFVLGHETRHATNHNNLEGARRVFDNDIAVISRSSNPVHDYTGSMRRVLDAHRNDEAGAHIAGYNAVVSMLRQSNPHPSLEDIYRAHPDRMRDFIERSPETPSRYSLRSGLSLNPDMSMSASPSNIAAMGRYYYDHPPSQARLGTHGNSNYQNMYAADLVGQVVQAERANVRPLDNPYIAAYPQMALDMRALGLSERILEANGLDLGDRRGRQRYVDLSAEPPAQSYFDDMARAQSQRHGHSPAGSRIEAPGSPALTQAMQTLERSPNIPTDAFGADRERIAAAVAAHAAGQGLRADHIVLNQSRTALIAVQGEAVGDPAARMSSPLPLEAARNTPLEQSLSRLQAAEAARAPQDDPVRVRTQPQDEPVRQVAPR